MKITKEEIKSMNPCSPGWEWYLKNCIEIEDLEQLLFKISSHRFDWAAWLFTSLMARKQCVEIAIFSARKALPIYTEKYPNDDRPEKAILAAEAWMKDPTKENRRDAARAADASAAAYAAATAAAASATTYAALAAARAAAARATTYADAAYAAAGTKASIIDEALRILTINKEKI